MTVPISDTLVNNIGANIAESTADNAPHTPVNSLIDSLGRKITYLRLSVTDRCDLRCTYCMSKKPAFLPKDQLLKLNELYNIAKTFLTLGIKKIRLTGGEPLVRRDIAYLITKLGALSRQYQTELCMTSNASQLSRFAKILADSNFSRINVSLDTLDPNDYSTITRGGNINKTLEGINSALDHGIKIKINTVALKNFNIHNIDPLIEFCFNKNIDITLIEVMPMGDVPSSTRLDSFYPLTKLKHNIIKTWGLGKSSHNSGGPAQYYQCPSSGCKVGFITPLSNNFCAGCNRVRVTATGTLYPCLGNIHSTQLKNAASEEDLKQLIYSAIAKKPASHFFKITKRSVSGSPHRSMNVTGG